MVTYLPRASACLSHKSVLSLTTTSTMQTLQNLKGCNANVFDHLVGYAVARYGPLGTDQNYQWEGVGEMEF